MKASDETLAEEPHNGAAGVSEEGSAGMTEVLSRFTEEILASVNGLIEVKADRVRHSVRRTAVKVAIATGAALCAGLWMGAAALATLRGLCGAFATLCGGRAWLGELCGGAFALLLAWGMVALLLQLSTRRELVRLEDKYERIRNRPVASVDREGPPADGGAAARSRGSAGDPAHQRIPATPG